MRLFSSGFIYQQTAGNNCYLKLFVVRLLFIPCLFFYTAVSAQWNTRQFSPSVLHKITLTDLQNSPAHINISGSKKLYAFVFLSPECPLCQNYTVTLNKLSRLFSPGSVQFYGIISGKSYSPGEVADFLKSYRVIFPLLIDRDKKLTAYLSATVTPEVKLLDANGALIYSGEIDNWAVSLGQQRAVVTENYLQNAIAERLEGYPVKVAHTQPVGCLINDR